MEIKELPAGSKIVFEEAHFENFGTITVVEGILDIVYFDGMTALVRMGKFPVLSATLVTDSCIIIGETDLKVSITEPISATYSRTKHVHWTDWSCWQ